MDSVWERRHPPTLILFLALSVLWHGLQFILFHSVFRIVPPPSMKGRESKTIGVKILSQRPDLQMMEWQESYGSSATQDSSADTSQPVQKPLQNLKESFKPRPLNRERTVRREKQVGPSKLPPPLTRESAQGEIVNQVKAPYSLTGDLAKRSILHSPTLPEYPKWAELAAVELRLTVTLSIDEKGSPFEVFISKSSGDSQTDLKVLRYTEELRFEPSLSKSRGEIRWFFELSK
jgi:TonB family protein